MAVFVIDNIEVHKGLVLRQLEHYLGKQLTLRGDAPACYAIIVS